MFVRAMQSRHAVGQILLEGSGWPCSEKSPGFSNKEIVDDLCLWQNCISSGGANEWVVRSRVRKQKEQVSSRNLELKGRRRKYFSCRGAWRTREGFTYLVFLL